MVENTLLTVTASATDADLPADTLTYSLVTAPTGATINPSTGVFTWTPGEADGPGTHNVTVRVSDGNGGTAETSFAITVTESNSAPVLAAIAAQTVAENTSLTVTASATDADLPADTLTYSLVTAPTGATINPATGVFTWTPGEADGPGSFNATIRVSDSVGATADTTFTITVTESNSAPVLATIAAQTVVENTVLTVTAGATDADLPADTLTYSLITAPTGATITPSTGVFTWTPGEADGPGSYNVIVRVADGNGGTADTSFTITVTESNSAPVLAAIAAQSVAENTQLTVTASATDADLPADTLTYSLVTAPTGATINPSTGVFTWTPSEADGPGTHNVTVRVSDGSGGTADTSFTITVTESNSAPVLAAIAAQSVAENTPLTVTASATDADLPANALTYSLVSAPTGATINPATGVFTWTPGPNDGPGTHAVTVRVTDGMGGIAETSFTITVTESNAAPALAGIAAQSIAENTLLTVTASATDADLPADTLTYSLVTGPTGAAINPGTGVFTWTPGEADGPGSYPVTIRVADAAGASSEASFTVTVTESNSTPVLSPILAQTIAEEALLTVPVVAADADLPANPLTYSLVTAPAAATIDPTSGVFTWTPAEADGPGSYSVTVRVSDGAGATAETSFAITVTETNTAPSLAAITPQAVVENTQLTVTASATDADLPADTLTYSLVTAPAGAAIGASTGVFTWTPDEANGPGSYPVTLRVTDGAGATAETTFTITVTESNTPPLFAAIAAQAVVEGSLLTVPTSASDVDLPANTLTYSLVSAPGRRRDRGRHRHLHMDTRRGRRTGHAHGDDPRRRWRRRQRRRHLHHRHQREQRRPGAGADRESHRHDRHAAHVHRRRHRPRSAGQRADLQPRRRAPGSRDRPVDRRVHLDAGLGTDRSVLVHRDRDRQRHAVGKRQRDDHGDGLGCRRPEPARDGSDSDGIRGEAGNQLQRVQHHEQQRHRDRRRVDDRVPPVGGRRLRRPRRRGAHGDTLGHHARARRQQHRFHDRRGSDPDSHGDVLRVRRSRRVGCRRRVGRGGQRPVHDRDGTDRVV